MCAGRRLALAALLTWALLTGCSTAAARLPARHNAISQIKCWLDGQGFVTGIAMETLSGGVESPGMCAGGSGLADGGVLEEGESIVDVVACSRGQQGYAWLEFHTDSQRNQPITCGAALPGSQGSRKLEGRCVSLRRSSRAHSGATQGTSGRAAGSRMTLHAQCSSRSGRLAKLEWSSA